jgi:tetratricopeptide (TPR) repeat protein
MTPELWQRLEAIFNEVVEAPPEDRSAVLERACGGAGELRVAVERMLAADGWTGRPIRQELQLTAAGVVGEAEAAARRIGPYTLLRELGRGGMGVVYLAVRDDDEYRKRVAIKVLPRGLESPAAVERFRRERQILAGLEHPNIARLLDGGSTEDGLPYIVMEYVDGELLLDYVARRGLSVPRRLDLFLAIASAVEYAHQQLVIHRDLKPANMLVGADGVPKLLDFGVAKLALEDGIAAATQTLAFTPEYASPEQVRGKPVTTASDVYALGTVLYELLSGRRAQESSPDLGTVYRAVCERDPPPPSAVSAPALTRTLRGDLDTIVLKALQKEPARRYGSVAMLSEDLRRHLTGQPVAARKDTATYRASKFVGRHRWAVGATMVVLLALGVALLVSVRATHRAERRYEEMRTLAGGLLFEIHDRIAKLPGSTSARALVVARAHEYLEKLSAEETDDPELRMDLAAAYLRLGDAQGGNFAPSLGRLDEALSSYSRARSLLDRLPPGFANQRLAELRAGLDINSGTTLISLSRYDEAKERLERGNAIARELRARRPADRYLELRSWTGLAHLAQMRSDRDGLLAAGRGAVEAAEALSRDAPRDAEALYWLCVAHESNGNGYVEAGDIRAAAEEQQEAARVIAEALAFAPNDVRLLREEGNVYKELGILLGDPYFLNQINVDGARRAVRRALTVFEMLHTRDPSDARGAHELLYTLSIAADIESDPRPQAALDLYERALATAANLGRDQAIANDRATTMTRSSHALLRGGRVVEAVRRAREGVAAKRAVLPRGRGEPLAGERLLEHSEGLRLLAEAESAAGHDPEALSAVGEAVSTAAVVWRAQPRNPKALFAVAAAESSLGDVHLASAVRSQRSKERAAALNRARAAFSRSIARWDEWKSIASEQPFVQMRRAAVAASLSRLQPSGPRPR